MLTLALLYRWTIWSLERSKNRQGHVLSDRRLLDSWSACPYSAHGEHGSGGTADCFLHLSVGRVGEGSGTPLQYSCLENPMDRGASKAACSSWGRWGLDTTERLHFQFSLSCIGEGNGNPLQCSCLENPKDRRVWWAAIYGVAESDTTEAT